MVKKAIGIKISKLIKKILIQIEMEIRVIWN